MLVRLSALGVALSCILVHHSTALPSFLKFGFCDDVPPLDNFDIDKFTGIWYTTLWVKNEYVKAQHCQQTSYTHYDGVDEHVLSVTYGLDEQRNPVVEEDTLDIEQEPFYMITRSKGSKPTVYISNYATDYTDYSCQYACVQQFTFKAEFVWVRSRHPYLNHDSVAKCRVALREHSNFYFDKLNAMDQGESCPHWTNVTRAEKDPEKIHSATSLIAQLSEMKKRVEEAVSTDMENTAIVLDLLESKQGGPNIGPSLHSDSLTTVLFTTLLCCWFFGR